MVDQPLCVRVSVHIHTPLAVAPYKVCVRMPVRSLDRMRISLGAVRKRGCFGEAAQERARERKACVLAVRSRTMCREI